MKTTKQQNKYAEQLNLYQFDSIPQHILEDKYFSENFKHKKEIFNKVSIPDGLSKLKGITVGVFAKVSEQFVNFTNEHELYYIENVYVLVGVEEEDELYQINNDKGKYCLSPIYQLVNQVQRNTSYKQRKLFLELLKEPNRIGVFSTKKVLDHVQYCKDYLTACLECEKSIENKKNENQLVIENFVNSLKNATVSKYQNRTTVENDLFCVVFELLDNGNYLNTKITYKNGLDGILEISNKCL